MSVLDVRDLHFRYGRAAVLNGIDLEVAEGEVVTVIGPNGAGKSTLLGVLSGALRPSAGEIRLQGCPLARRHTRVVRAGCVLVPEGRQVFSSLSVVDNLVLGGWSHRRGARRGGGIDEVYALFPRLHERAEQLAGTLSGGEQQMLAIGRAMMGRPRLLLLDEPSLGLAPQMVKHIFEALDRLRADGMTLLLVEQNARAALRLADRGYLLSEGRVLVAGSSSELAADPTVRRVYLGDERPARR